VTQPCETCGRDIADGATICVGCAYKLDAAIADVAAYRGLAYDLELAITRQTQFGTKGGGGRSTETPVAFDQRASAAAAHLKGVLVGWARVIAEETGADLPADDLARIAAWLRPRVGWLRHHVAGAEAWDEILQAVKEARHVCDRPAETLYAGPCDCGEDLYARLEAEYVTCRSDAHDDPVVWEVQARRRWLLQSAEDVLATTTDISRALTRYQQPVTPEAIRGYVHRGKLIARGKRLEGKREIPVYRLGDVLDILARQAERA
jgi:hypothetical protein